MKINKLTKAMEAVKAPHDAVDKAVKAALEADKRRKQPKLITGQKIRRFVSVAAACAVLAAGITAGQVYHQNKNSDITGNNADASSNSHSFSLLVNAAEITEDEKIGLSEIDFTGVNSLGMNAYSSKQKLTNETIETVTPEGEIWNRPVHVFRMQYRLYPVVEIPIVCKGNGIKSVTYKVNGAYLKANRKLNLLSEGTEEGPHEVDYYDLVDLYTEKNRDTKYDPNESLEGLMNGLTDYSYDYDHDEWEKEWKLREAIRDPDDKRTLEEKLKERYYYTYKSMTVSYEEQLKCVEVDEKDLVPYGRKTYDPAQEKEIRGSVAAIALLPSFSPELAKDELTKEAQEYMEGIPSGGSYGKFIEGKEHTDYWEALFNAYRSQIENVSLEVTVHFDDGTDEGYILELIPGERKNYSYYDRYDNRIKVQTIMIDVVVRKKNDQ